MSAPLHYSMPASFHSGETVKLSLSYGDYPASGGWTLKLYLAGASIANFSGTPTDTGFAVTLSAAATTLLEPGNYKWRTVVTSGSESYVADDGVVAVGANIIEQVAGGMQSVEEKHLNIIEALLTGRLETDMESYQIAGRAVTRIPIRELLELRATFKRTVEQQRNPGSFGPQIRVAFTGAENEL